MSSLRPASESGAKSDTREQQGEEAEKTRRGMQMRMLVPPAAVSPGYAIKTRRMRKRVGGSVDEEERRASVEMENAGKEQSEMFSKDGISLAQPF